jgi:hypothetical protein
MSRTPRFIRAAALGIAFVLVATTADAQQPPALERVRGQVAALDGKNLKIKARDGKDVTVTLPDNVTVSAMVKVDIGDIKQNAYVGVAGIPQGDKIVAQAIQIFPEGFRPPEGYGPWDLTPDSTMTNATVESVVTQASGREIKLKYKDGEKTVTIPPNAAIVGYQPGDASMLKPGASVFIMARKSPDGMLTAPRVAVGKDGLVPPL